MAMSKKHQPVGQRYQIGDRVYRKKAVMGSKRFHERLQPKIWHHHRSKYQCQRSWCR